MEPENSTATATARTQAVEAFAKIIESNRPLAPWGDSLHYSRHQLRENIGVAIDHVFEAASYSLRCPCRNDLAYEENKEELTTKDRVLRRLENFDPLTVVGTLREEEHKEGHELWVTAVIEMQNRWIRMIDQHHKASNYSGKMLEDGGRFAVTDNGAPLDPSWISPNGNKLLYIWDYNFDNQKRLKMIQAMSLGSQYREHESDPYDVNRPRGTVGGAEPGLTLHLLISRYMVVLAHQLVNKVMKSELTQNLPSVY